MEQMTYSEYMNSSQWRHKANAAKARAGYRCQICNANHKPNKLHAHHRTYERLGQEDDMDLTVLCVPCHKLFHSVSGVDTKEIFTVVKVEPIVLAKNLSELW